MMKKALLVVGLLNCCCGYAQETGRYTQGSKNTNSGDAISIGYGIGSSKNQTLFASPNNNNDLTKGVAFNNGNTIRYQVSSTAPYFVKVFATDAVYVPSAGNSIQNQHTDIRDYIYFKIVDNETGGLVLVESRHDGEVLGTMEKTIIINCPATQLQNHSSHDDTKYFSLGFKIKPGYSLPPGNYMTHLLITASLE